MDDLQVEDPTIWIADTGATVHSTPHQNLLVSSHPANDDTVVVMGNGNQEIVTAVETVKGTAVKKR